MKRSESALMQMKKKELVELILQEQVEGNPLGQKTKQELIDIILRKDDVEIKLKNTIESKEEVIEALNERNANLEAEVQRQDAEHNEDMHCIMDCKKALHNTRKRIRIWQLAFAITLIAAIIIIGCIA